MPEKKLRLTDNSLMTFGKQHKGKPMSDVPASYLIWVWENTDIQEKMRLGLYIEENFDNLRKEASKEKK